MAIVEVTADEMRRVLDFEGVFRCAYWTDDWLLGVCWAVRESPEYQTRLRESDPGLDLLWTERTHEV